MKFRRFLAALLGSLMIVSMMSFTANVSAAENGVIKEFIFAKNADMTPPVENGARATKMYDEENDVVFFRIRPKAGNVSVYVNSGSANVPFTEAQAAEDDNYLVYYARTNIDTDAETPGVQCTAPAAMQYTCTWTPTITNNPTLTQVTSDGFGVTANENWQKFCFKVQSKYEKDGQTYLLSKWAQVAFGPVGLRAVMSGDKMFTYNEDPYYDVAGYTVVDSLEAAIAYDFAVEAQAEKVTVSFDMGDGSDLIEKTVLAGTDAKVEFPEVAERQDYLFLGWATDAEGANIIEDTANVVAPDEDTTYYAIWQDNTVPVEFTLDSLTINGSAASNFGVSDINAEEIVVTLPYGWEALEGYGVMPAVVPTATAPATATYVAPATLADAGKITFAQGNSTGEVAIKFVIGAAPEAKTAGINKVQAGVYSTTGVITLPDGSEINADNKTRAVGMKTDKNITHYGITANKFTPIYKGSELDGTMVSATEYYSSNRSVNLEGYDCFKLFDFESYNAYRALVYYDTGADGKFDIEVKPRLYYQSSSTTGTMNTNGTARKDSMVPASGLKGDRWEYIYFTKSELNMVLYGKAIQPVFSFFAKDDATKSYNYTDDTFYFAEITMLPECPDVVYYKPTTVNAVAVDGDKPGYIEGVTDDMEMLVDDEWVAVTELDTYADGVIGGLTAGEYSVRYAADDIYGASEAVVLDVLPGAVFVTFDAQNDTENTVYELEINTALTAPANPTKGGYVFKGWATEKDGEVVTLPAVATETITYYAVWEKIEVVYVKGSAETNGDGLTPETPYNTWTAAGTFAYNYGGTIVVMDDVAWTQKVNNGSSNSAFNYVYADVTITSVDPVTGVDYPGALVQTGSFNFWGDWTKTITIKDIEIASWRYQSASDKWQYINFNGMIVDLDNITVRTGDVPVGYTVGSSSPVADGDAKEIYFPVHMRTLGEAGGKGNGVTNAVIGDVEFKSIVIGGKVIYNEANNWYAADIDFEFNGSSNSALSFGNDSTKSTSDGKSYYQYGRLNNVKMLLETAPKSIGFSCISGINGSVQMIANNGAVVNAPVFSYTNTDDKTTNEDGSVFVADLTPAKGFWKINSAVGGRVDFTETDGTFAVTTDATYIVVTDKATGESTRIRVADGVTGDANLFEDGAYTLALEAGEYDIAYTDEGVKVNVTFENGDADETYALAKGETATFAGTVTAPAGKTLYGWADEANDIGFEGNSYTADEYVAAELVFTPVFVDDPTAPYYYLDGEYDKLNGKYAVTVSIANGKYAAGTVGLAIDASILEFESVEMADGVSNNLGTEPVIVKENISDDAYVLVWDATAGIIDATEYDVDIATFTYNVLDADSLDNGEYGIDYFVPTTAYDKYFDGEYYLASPENTSDNPYAVEYVPVYYGDIHNKIKSYEKANITFNITFKGKAGASEANIGELVIYTDDTEDVVYELDKTCEDETVSITVSDFYVGEALYFYVHKNGYLEFEEGAVYALDGTVVNVTLLGGDIKDAEEICCGDGTITLADFVRVVRAFDTNANADYKATVDINEDAVVNVMDLAIVKANFGKTSEDNTYEVISPRD
ncbi:MAG: InlB B-repeat-containing protein [Clostridia bacterium]|nr:InlB B-repeat-containing protein [Clostridia bacterium]